MSTALYYTYQPQQQSMSYSPNVNQSQQQQQQQAMLGAVPNGYQQKQFAQQQPRIPLAEASFYPPVDPNSVPVNFNNNNPQRIRQQMVSTMSNNPSYNNSSNSNLSSNTNNGNNTNQKVINGNEDQINNKVILPPITSIIDKNGNGNNESAGSNEKNTTPERKFANITPETTSMVNTVPVNGTNTISPPLNQVKLEPQHQQMQQIPSTMPPSLNNNISPITPDVVTWDPMNNEKVKYIVPHGQNPNMGGAVPGPQFYTPNMYYQPQPGFQQPIQQRPNETQTQQQLSPQQQQQQYAQYQYYMQMGQQQQQPQNPQQFQQHQMMANRSYANFQPNYIPQPQQQYIDRKGSIAMMPAGNFSVINPAMYPQFAPYNVAEDIDTVYNHNNNENTNAKKSSKKRKNSKCKSAEDLQPGDIDSLEEEALENAVSINNIPSLATIQTNLNIAKRLRKQCPVCGKICSRPSTLKTHYLIHSGDTPFKCTWKGCTKSFNVKSNMLRHLKSHKRKLQKELLKKEIELRKAGGTSNFTSFADVTKDSNGSPTSNNAPVINGNTAVTTTNSTTTEQATASATVPSVSNITDTTNAPSN
ncbi:hypothetical protein MOUN0_C03004 [Monosporozyma unispora]